MSSRAQPPPRPSYDAASLTDVAVKVFRERGYDATSMEQLATAAGITKAGFYHHVTGKEQLLGAGMDRALDALEALFEEPDAAAGSSLDQLSSVIRRVVQLEDLLLSEVTVLLRARGNSDVERVALERRRAFDRRIGKLVEQAQRDGLVRAELDAQLAGRLIIGMATWLVEWYRPDGPLMIDDVADHVVNIALHGIVAESTQVPVAMPTDSATSRRKGRSS